MNRALILLFLAGALTMAPAASRVTAAQSTAQTAENPQPQATGRAPSHNRHHTKHNTSTTRRLHRHHKTSAKH